MPQLDIHPASSQPPLPSWINNSLEMHHSRPVGLRSSVSPMSSPAAFPFCSSSFPLWTVDRTHQTGFGTNTSIGHRDRYRKGRPTAICSDSLSSHIKPSCRQGFRGDTSLACCCKMASKSWAHSEAAAAAAAASSVRISLVSSLFFAATAHANASLFSSNLTGFQCSSRTDCS